EHEGEIEQMRIEGRGLLDQDVPGHRIQPLAHYGTRGQIDQERAEQGQGDADAAENEVLPGGFDRRGRPVKTHHQDCGERHQLDGDPHQPHVVRQQRQVHGEHERLVHGVIEAQVNGGQPPGFDLMGDVAGTEDAGREGDERGEDDKHHVHVVDDKERAGFGAKEKQRQRSQEREQRSQCVELAGEAIVGKQRQQRRACDRHQQHRVDQQRAQIVHAWPPRKRSSACTSMVSKRSRMRNRKMPTTISAMMIENATLISTTSGMPLAAVAARIRPFSIDMKPMIWLTALRREIIIRRPSRITESEKARSSRVSVPASAVIGSITMIDRATSPMPASMVWPMLPTVSMVRWMPSRTMMRCSATGMTMALTTSAMPAVMYRCGAD